MQVKGHLELAVLRSLKERELHGYAIVKMLQLTGVPELGGSEGTVYPLLLRLEKQGHVKARWLDGRKLYRLSRQGEGLFAQRLEEWKSLRGALDAFIVNPEGQPS